MEGSSAPPSARHFRPWIWEKPSSVMNFESISEEPNQERPPTSRTRGFTTSSSGKQTVRWPFHSFSNSRSSIPNFPRRTSNTRSSVAQSSGSFPRRAAGSISRSVSTVLTSDVIPDYIVHFLRGETPETLARRHHMALPHSPEPSQFPRDYRMDRYSNDSAEISPGNSRPGTPHAEREKMLRDEPTKRQSLAGWRGGVAVNLLLAFLVLLPAAVCLTIAAVKGHVGLDESAFMSGSPRMVQDIHRGILAAVNIFAVMLIAGGNYVVQILASPTRAEVDSAHGKRKWLDIGVPTVRNLGGISKLRAFLSVVVILVVIISQVIYNSLLIVSQTVPTTSLALVSTSFMKADNFADIGTMSHAALVDLQEQAGKYLLVRLDPDECLSTFNNLFQTEYRSALVIMKDSKASALIQSAEGLALGELLDDLDWDKSSISYCLAERVRESSSSLYVNGPLLGAITLANVILVALFITVMVAALNCRTFNPLVTLGDALASFLNDPDTTTQDSCLVTKKEIKKGLWGGQEASYWLTQSCRWYHVPSVTRWMVWLLTWVVPVGLTTAALSLASTDGPKNPFGSFDSPTAVYKVSQGLPRTGLAVIAALPHLFLGVLYLTTNALLTTCYLSHESSQYATGSPLPLRVSTGQPMGSQTTSLYLTLPRPISWMLFFLVTAMGFLISQGVTVVTVDRNGEGPISGVGFTPLPLLLLGALLVVMGFGVLGMSLRKVDSRGAVESGQPAGNPLVLLGGTCSAVLSARCHRVPRESGVEASQIRWGVVREGVGMSAGHATFSNRSVGDVLVGRSYA